MKKMLLPKIDIFNLLGTLLWSGKWRIIRHGNRITIETMEVTGLYKRMELGGIC